jgi:hypothetical protein
MSVQECIANAMENGLSDALSALEETRLAVLSSNRKIMTGAFAFFIAVTAYITINHISMIALAFAGIIITIITYFIVSRRNGRVSMSFKETAMPELVAIFGPTFRYNARSYIDESQFNSTGLYMRPDRYSGKDYVSGIHGRTDLNFSMVHAEERYETTETDTDSDGHTTTRTTEHWRDIFKGLFFSADMNKHFAGMTRVRSGKAGWLSGLFGNTVKLEDPRFTNQFNVSSTDQVEARYILTPKFMERLTELKSKLGNFDLSFTNSRVNIAINLSYNAFEPDVRRPFTDFSQLTAALSALFLIIGIIDDLDLNTRIWTKE